MVNRHEPLGRTLVFTAKAMREAFEGALASAGGSLGTWVVLSALSDLDFVSQAALASHVHLEAAGLVRRLIDPEDRRARRLELAQAGSELHERLLAAVTSLEHTVLNGLSADDRETLHRHLATIQANLATRDAPTA